MLLKSPGTTWLQNANSGVWIDKLPLAKSSGFSLRSKRPNKAIVYLLRWAYLIIYCFLTMRCTWEVAARTGSERWARGQQEEWSSMVAGEQAGTFLMEKVPEVLEALIEEISASRTFFFKTHKYPTWSRRKSTQSILILINHRKEFECKTPLIRDLAAIRVLIKQSLAVCKLQTVTYGALQHHRGVPRNSKENQSSLKHQRGTFPRGRL